MVPVELDAETLAKACASHDTLDAEAGRLPHRAAHLECLAVGVFEEQVKGVVRQARCEHGKDASPVGVRNLRSIAAVSGQLDLEYGHALGVPEVVSLLISKSDKRLVLLSWNDQTHHLIQNHARAALTIHHSSPGHILIIGGAPENVIHAHRHRYRLRSFLKKLFRFPLTKDFGLLEILFVEVPKDSGKRTGGRRCRRCTPRSPPPQPRRRSSS
mmetsp:Transcript_6167/g.12533  ORF Transcript_6167/g.12533 Transcript_6167/m.12533 type:complete len:214 (-) Transcript_6167:159-800(-)